jgi:hypothetical protein
MQSFVGAGSARKEVQAPLELDVSGFPNTPRTSIRKTVRSNLLRLPQKKQIPFKINH